MRQSNLLILNTLITYVRMALTVGLGLLTTRLLLKVLGFDAFGLIITLGASAGLLGLISDALTSSAQRHLAYEIGRNDLEQLRVVFNSVLFIFLAGGAAVVVLGSALAPILLRILTIPAEHREASWWVLEAVLFSTALVMAGVPFVAMAEARQAMTLTALRDLCGSMIELSIILAVMVLPGERLINYAWLLVLGRGLLFVSFSALIIWFFPVSRPRPSLFSVQRVREIITFAGWTTLWTLGWRLRTQGATLLLNMRFGPTVNAADAIAVQVAGYQNAFGSAIYTAARPAVISIHARGGTEPVKSLVLLASKYPSLLLCFILVPVQIETEALLRLWLGDYPPLTPEFVRLMTIWMGALLLSRGYHLAMLARGDLGMYTILMSAFDVLVLLCAAIGFYAFGLQPLALPVMAVVITLGQVWFQAWFAGRRIDLPLRKWLSQVVRPVLFVAGLGAAFAFAISRTFDEGWPRLLALVVAYVIAVVPLIWFLGLERWERQLFIASMSSVIRRVRGRGRQADVVGPAADGSAGTRSTEEAE